MEQDIKISVIIPTYNRLNYVKNAVQSVCNQSVESIEIIVVDDASDVDIKTTLNGLNDNRIRLLINSKNMGSDFSRNKGLRMANGEFIAFLDDDDEFTNKNKLQRQIELFNKNEKIGFVGCGYLDVSTGEKKIPHYRGKIANLLLVSYSNIETSTILIKKNIIEKVGFFDEKLPSEQNHDFFYRISKICEFDYLDEIMVRKNNPANQISSNPAKKLKGYILFHRKHFKDIKKLNVTKIFYLMGKFIFVCLLFFSSKFFKRNLVCVKKINDLIH